MPVPHNKLSRGVQPRVTAKHGNGRRQHMAFPRHPIIDVTPIDAARGSSANRRGGRAHRRGSLHAANVRQAEAGR